jgi:hypothetical protein
MSQLQFVNFRGKSYRIRRNSLILRNKGITDIGEIEGLNNLPFLGVLDLSDNNITEIRGLQNLTNLAHLNFSNNNISEIKGIDNLSNLIYLDLSKNNISEIKGLENLRRLITLNLEGNSIREMKGLENLHRLNALYLSRNNITEVKGIEHLRSLKRLDLGKKTQLRHQKAQALKSRGVLLKEQHYFTKKYIWYLIGYFLLVIFVDLLISLAIVSGFELGGDAYLPMFGTLFVPCLILAPFLYAFARAYYP